jgi:hypothetical protein
LEILFIGGEGHLYDVVSISPDCGVMLDIKPEGSWLLQIEVIVIGSPLLMFFRTKLPEEVIPVSFTVLGNGNRTGSWGLDCPSAALAAV